MTKFEDTFHGRPNTISIYKCLFKKHIEPLNIQLDQLINDENLILSIINKWEAKNLSKNTKLSLIKLLSKYIKFLGGYEINTRKFTQMLQRSEQQREVVTLSAEEAKRVMDVTKQVNLDFYPILLLALHAGLRRGEIFGLRHEDINLKNRKIKVSHSYDGPTKNGKSRIVPMSNELFNIFYYSSNFKTGNPHELLFERFDPNPNLKYICSQAGIRKICFHDLRHTFASLALTNGINAKQVSTWLGHSSVSTTLDLYWNLTDEKVDLGFLPE